MTREEDINPKKENLPYIDCSICCESFTPETKIVLFICCTTTSDLKALDSICAEKTFAEEFRCPYCRAEDEKLKFVTFDYELFKNLTLLSEEELKEILDQKETHSPEVILENIKQKLTLTPEQKDLHDFLRKNNLLSNEYFDDSPLPVKLEKLLNDKVLPNIMLSAIEKFLVIGMDVNATDKDGWTALHLICRNWPEAKVPPEIMLIVTNKLLEANINVNGIMNGGWNALHIICRHWPEEKVPSEIMLATINKLLEANINVNVSNNSDGATALHYICSCWPTEVSHQVIFAIIEKFLIAGADINAIDKEGNTALQILENFPDEETKKLAKAIHLLITVLDNSPLPVKMKKLLDYKVSPDGMLSALGKFIDMGMDVNAVDEDGRNALHYICHKWEAEKTPPHRTVLTTIIPHEAIPAIIDKFLEAGIDVNAADKYGYTILHHVCHWNNTEILSEIMFPVINKLLRAKFNINAVDDYYGYTILHLVCICPSKVSAEINLAIIDKLLEAKINVNVASKYRKETALHFICRSWPQCAPHKTILTIVEKLLKAGANVDAVNQEGKTPLQILESFPDDNSKKLTKSVRSLIASPDNETQIFSAEQLISMLKKSTYTLEKTIQIAGQYLFQKIDANEIETAIKVWNWIHKYSSLVEEFEKFIMTSENFNHLLNFFWTFSHLNRSFRKSSEVISSYHRAVELLLTQKNHFVLSIEQLKILEEVAVFDEQLLSPQLSMGLNLALATNVAAYDINKAQRYILQAAKTGWLVGYILPTQRFKHRSESIMSMDETILYLREIVFSPHASVSNLNKKCFTFALANLRVYATNKEILALKTLGDYYLKIGKTKEAIDYFLQTKNKAETVRQQELANDKYTSIIFEATLALGRLSYESGAIVKACQEYSYGPAYIAMARMCIKDESGSQIFEVVKYLCQAMTTAFQPQIKTASEDLIKHVSLIQTDQNACFKLIGTLADFIDANKSDIAALQIPLLMKLIQTLKLEKLFFENTDREEKFELFSHKFSSKTQFSTNLARAFILLTENKSTYEICQSIKEGKNQEKILIFYQQFFEDDNHELPAYLFNREIRECAALILLDLKGLRNLVEEDNHFWQRFDS